VGYKINIQKKVVVLYTNNKLKKKFLKAVSCIICIKKNLEINHESCRTLQWELQTLMNKILENINNGRTSYAHGFVELILLKYYLQQSTHSIWSPSKCHLCQSDFFYYKKSTDMNQFLRRKFLFWLMFQWFQSMVVWFHCLWTFGKTVLHDGST
jgi:hypothetical protein